MRGGGFHYQYKTSPFLVFSKKELTNKYVPSHITAQRAHANFTENLSPFLVTLLGAGLRFPVPAAALGAAWLAARVVYTVGYTSSKGPKGRMLYVFFLFFPLHAPLLGVSRETEKG